MLEHFSEECFHFLSYLSGRSPHTECQYRYSNARNFRGTFRERGALCLEACVISRFFGVKIPACNVHSAAYHEQARNRDLPDYRPVFRAPAPAPAGAPAPAYTSAAARASAPRAPFFAPAVDAPAPAPAPAVDAHTPAPAPAVDAPAPASAPAPAVDAPAPAPVIQSREEMSEHLHRFAPLIFPSPGSTSLSSASATPAAAATPASASASAAPRASASASAAPAFASGSNSRSWLQYDPLDGARDRSPPSRRRELDLSPPGAPSRRERESALDTSPVFFNRGAYSDSTPTASTLDGMMRRISELTEAVHTLSRKVDRQEQPSTVRACDEARQYRLCTLSVKAENLVCVVCFTEDKSRLLLTPCHHVVCVDCKKTMLRTFNHSCPQCRRVDCWKYHQDVCRLAD
jgi:hypothetical protein